MLLSPADLAVLKAIEDNINAFLDGSDRLHKLVLYQQLYAEGVRIDGIGVQIEREVRKMSSGAEQRKG